MLLYVPLANFENVVDYSVELNYIFIKLNYIVEPSKGWGYET